VKDGTTKMMRKAALQIFALALLACIAWNAYIAVEHLLRTEKTAALALENTNLQANISAVSRELSDMETGQRGYLLTADPAYLQPYNEAKSRIHVDIAGLRTGLALRSEHEQALATQLESLANSKQDEMERTINFRQQGYRHRAFKLVESNEGMDYMNRARAILSELATAGSSRSADFDHERRGSVRATLLRTAIVNVCLLALAAGLFVLMRYHARKLEQENAQSGEQLAARDLQLSKLNFILSNQARSKTSAIEANARLLLETYGGFLPVKGHECAEQIKDASAEMELLRQELVCVPSSNGNHRAA